MSSQNFSERVSFIAQMQLIREECGGNSRPLSVGARPMLRMQRFIREWLAEAYDVTVTKIVVDAESWSATVELLAKLKADVSTHVQTDQLVELLDGFRVIAVGKITRVIQREADNPV